MPRRQGQEWHRKRTSSSKYSLKLMLTLFLPQRARSGTDSARQSASALAEASVNSFCPADEAKTDADTVSQLMLKLVLTPSVPQTRRGLAPTL